MVEQRCLRWPLHRRCRQRPRLLWCDLRRLDAKMRKLCRRRFGDGATDHRSAEQVSLNGFDAWRRSFPRAFLYWKFWCHERVSVFSFMISFESIQRQCGFRGIRACISYPSIVDQRYQPTTTHLLQSSSLFSSLLQLSTSFSSHSAITSAASFGFSDGIR